MTAVKEWRRLYTCILFVCEAHGMDLGAFYGHESFYITDTIDGKPVRFGLLGVLLRIGDLLDLDENRTSDFIRKLYPSRFRDETSQRHHQRHEHIARFSITPKTIDVSVLASDVEEYHIWDRWLHYLKEDILYANTYLMPKLGNGLHLPELKTEIGKAEGASFETEELRFELAEEGQIWNILSQSVYTEEFDFIRELVQNGIDAILMKEYQDTALELTHPSPRSWGTWDRNERVAVAYSEVNRLLLIWDTGIGMDPDQVRRFLFRIADSGHHYQPRTRDFPLHTIAKFGIGFISCLSKCEEIVLYTYPANSKAGCKVHMYSNSTHAYFEELEPQPASGTTVCMKLKRNYSIWEVQNYLARTFRYPSTPVEWLDLDQMEQQIEGLADMKRLKHQLVISSCGQMPQHQFEPDYDYFEAVRDGVFKERYEEKELVKRLSDELEQHWKQWSRQEKTGSKERSAVEAAYGVDLEEVLDPAFMDDYEPEDLLRDYMQSEQLMQEIVTLLHQLDVGRHRITWKEKVWTECLGAYDGQYLNRSPEKEEHSGDFMERTLHVLLTTNGMEAEATALENSIRTGSGMYQDGMLLDVDPTGLVPLGLCRVRANLTGPAQMELNVTRRHVDESRTKLDVWIANVGVSIQQRVIEQVEQAIQRWGFCGDLSALCTEEESSNEYFDRRSRELFLAHGINSHIALLANGNH